MKDVKIINESTPVETLDLVVIEKTVGTLNTNIEELEKFVDERLKEYDPKKFEGDADLAKKKRAELNTAKQKLTRSRIELIKELMKPYSDFEERCKRLERKVDTASGYLDEIVKLKEQEEKDNKRKKIELFWATKNFDLFPLEKIFNQKWLNKTYKESDILDEMDARINKTYKDLKTCEKYAEMYGLVSDDVKAHYLMNLNIEETITFCDELQRQKEIAQKEAEQRAEREHNEKIRQQVVETYQEETEKENNAHVEDLASLALAENGYEEPEEIRKEYVFTVKVFDSELLELKKTLNNLGIEFSVQELTF